MLYLYRQWLQRELHMRFRSSALGLGWLVLQPLAQIVLFTLVFYQFFQVRWPQGDGSVGEYGLQVFIGLSLFTFVAEVINRSPASVSGFPYLITKVRFPMLLLPAVVVGAGLVQLTVSPPLNASARFGLVTLNHRQESTALHIVREQLPRWIQALDSAASPG